MATCIHSSRSCLPPFYTIPIFHLLNRKIFHLLVCMCVYVHDVCLCVHAGVLCVTLTVYMYLCTLCVCMSVCMCMRVYILVTVSVFLWRINH